jgi:hypothetical protein
LQSCSEISVTVQGRLWGVKDLTRSSSRVRSFSRLWRVEVPLRCRVLSSSLVLPTMKRTVFFALPSSFHSCCYVIHSATHHAISESLVLAQLLVTVRFAGIVDSQRPGRRSIAQGGYMWRTSVAVLFRVSIHGIRRRLRVSVGYMRTGCDVWRVKNYRQIPVRGGTRCHHTSVLVLRAKELSCTSA